MVKTAEELISELKQGTLSTFWISRNDDVPWVDRITIVTKKQQSEIIDLYLELLKEKKIIKVPKNKNAKGFCKKDTDLSPSFYRYLEDKDRDTDIIVYADDGEYSGMSIIEATSYPNKTWHIYVNLLCSIKKGTGTKIIDMLKDAIKTNKKHAGIRLTPLSSAVEFYKKMGFNIGEMHWVYFKNKNNTEQEAKVSSGGYIKNGIKTLKLKHLKNAETASRNITQKSSKFIR